MDIQSLRREIHSLKMQGLASATLASRLHDLVHAFMLHPSLAQLMPELQSKGLYQRYRLSDPRDDFHIILVAWAPGQTSPIHDHHDIIGAVATLQGQVIETRFRRDISMGPLCKLEPTAQYELSPLSVSQILPGKEMQLHQMTNAGQQWAATLHVYLERLEQFQIYRPWVKPWYMVRPQTLWFDEDTQYSEPYNQVVATLPFGNAKGEREVSRL